MTSLRPARRFDWNNLRQRAMSATVLAPLAILAVWFGGWLLLIVLAAAAALLAVEWSVMSAPHAPTRMSVVITVTLLLALFTAELKGYAPAWVVLALAPLVCALVARGVAERPTDAAFGAVYIGLPCLALSWIRNSDVPGHPYAGRDWTILLLAVTWAADIGAFAVGNLLKGPKLWPRFSPNKTWSGFGGGLAAAIAASVTVGLITHMMLSVAAAALMGLIGGLATMGGDLLESMLKRRFGVKDSGDLIPGHGGLLDRVDGLLFAILAVALARLIHLEGWRT